MSKLYESDYLKMMDALVEDCSKEVISTVSGISVTRVEKVDSLEGGYLSILQLHGDFNGMLLVKTSEQSIKTLTSYMTGIDDECINDKDMHDCICELANMICGLTKAKSARSKVTFSLSTPFSVRCSGDTDFLFKKGIPICNINLSGAEILIVIYLILV